MTQHLFLFDVDGVLVEARGYLRALQDTVAYFSRHMGVGEHPPTEEEIRIGEAQGMTSEWDSAPTYIATLLLERLRRGPDFPLPAQWDDALAALAARPQSLPHPDYAAVAARVGARLRAYGLGTVEVAPTAREVLWEEAQRTLPAALHPAVDALLDSLLGDTHTFAACPITQHFQHLALGSRNIPATYGVPPTFETYSYLERYDRPRLHEETRRTLLDAEAAGNLRIAIYTARPSLPPKGVTTSTLGYSPEAEIILAALGLEQIPLISLGRIAWLASETGERTAALLKPSPVQAFAAIGAALSGEEIPALWAAYTFHRHGELRPPLTLSTPTVVHLFEDGPSNIRAVAEAVAQLRRAGLPLRYRAYGIASPGGPKAAMMAAQGIPCFASTDEAVAAALARVRADRSPPR